MVDLSEMGGKAGNYGTRCALIRESRIFREGAQTSNKTTNIQGYMQKKCLICNQNCINLSKYTE